MFDVPVLDVTVSSAPTIMNTVGQFNEIEALSTPQIASALLDAAAQLVQPADTLPDMAGKDFQSQSIQPATLLPEVSIALFEPLNMADAADSLEKVFALSLDSAVSRQALTSIPESTALAGDASTDAESRANKANQQDVSINGENKAAAIANSSSPLLGDNLRQCLDEVPQGEFQGVTTFQVWRQGAIIGEVSSVDGTAQMVRSLQGIMAPGTLEASAITPVLGGEQPAIRLSSDVMLHIASHVGNDAKDSSAFSHEWAAIAWSDQLRQSLGAEPLDAGDVQTMLKGLQPSGQQLSGTASWYGPYFHGRLTANGETFDQNTLTAAHKTLPFNTVLQVRNLKNNRSVVVRINDRGPYIGKRSIDLSKAAAQCLGSEQAGVIPYEAVILEQLSAASEAN